MSGGPPMTGAELQVSGCSGFLPEAMGGGKEEITATTGPGPSPMPESLASSPAVTAPIPGHPVLSFPDPRPKISGPLSPGNSK